MRRTSPTSSISRLWSILCPYPYLEVTRLTLSGTASGPWSPTTGSSQRTSKAPPTTGSSLRTSKAPHTTGCSKRTSLDKYILSKKIKQDSFDLSSRNSELNVYLDFGQRIEYNENSLSKIIYSVMQYVQVMIITRRNYYFLAPTGAKGVTLSVCLCRTR